jgi:hypothetical protein
VRYLQQGLDQRDARLRATAEGQRLFGQGQCVRCPVAVRSDRTVGKTDGQAGRVKTQVRSYLDAHPDAAVLTVRQVLSNLGSEGIRAGRTTVAEVLQERKQFS